MLLIYNKIMLKNNFFNNYSQKQFYIFTLIVFIISKAIIFYIGITPNLLFGYWQTLDNDLLQNDLAQSLIFLHSEPILWNLILGLSLKIFENYGQYLTLFFHIFHLSLSFFILHYTYKILTELKFDKKITLLVAIFLIFSPNIIYYENWIFYSHLSCFLFFQLFYFTVKIFKQYSLKNELFVYLNLLIQTLVWKLFHPIIILLYFIFFIFLINKFLNLRSIIVFILFFSLSMLPTVKNKLVFNFFSGGSLVGLNLAQTIPSLGGNGKVCDFHITSEDENNYFLEFDKERSRFNHPSLTGKRSGKNNVGGIYKSKKCLKMSLRYIKNNPIVWLQGRFINILKSHVKFAIDHGFSPNGWKKYFGFISELKTNNISKIFKIFFVFSYMMVMYFFYLKKIFFSKEELFVKKSFFCIFTFYAYIVFIGHFVNGWEQERFLYTGFALQIIFIAYLFKKLIRIKS